MAKLTVDDGASPLSRRLAEPPVSPDPVEEPDDALCRESGRVLAVRGQAAVREQVFPEDPLRAARSQSHRRIKSVAALPSGALGESLRAALGEGVLAAGPLAVLAAWAVVLRGLAARLFRWS